jgi:trimethylamine--corrinoid protein Co-methyltransferase
MDAQAGAEAMFSIITAMQSRCNVIHDVGYLEFGTTASLEMLVMANELVAMSRFFTGGIPVNAETLALEAIDRVATAGETAAIFLADDHAYKHFKAAQFLPRLLDRSQHESWEAAGSTSLYDRCNAEAKKILSEHRMVPKPEGLFKEIDQILM